MPLTLIDSRTTAAFCYEGHDEPRSADTPDPKAVDQPEHTPHGGLNQNGQFARAARLHRDKGEEPELVHVYEKISRIFGRSMASFVS